MVWCKRCRPRASPQPHGTRTKPCCGPGSGEALPGSPCGFAQAGGLNSGSPFPLVPGAKCLTALAPPGSPLGAKRTYSVSSRGHPVCCVLDIPCPHVVVLCAVSPSLLLMRTPATRSQGHAHGLALPSQSLQLHAQAQPYPGVLRVTGSQLQHRDLSGQSSACTESNRKSPPASRPRWVGRQRFTSRCFSVGPKN